MRTSNVAAAAVAALGAMAKPRYLMYFDTYVLPPVIFLQDAYALPTRWDTTNLPDHSVTAGVTHVSTAFAGSAVFNSGTWYQPFMPLDQIRALFDDGVKVCMSIGGWGDTSGFSAGAQTSQTRQTYAQNVAAAIKTLGYDCVGEYDTCEVDGGTRAPIYTNISADYRHRLGVSRRKWPGL